MSRSTRAGSALPIWRDRVRPGALAAGLWIALVLLLAEPLLLDSRTSTPFPLTPNLWAREHRLHLGETVQALLRRGGVRSYRVFLEAGQMLEGSLEDSGIGLSLAILPPHGEAPLLDLESPGGGLSPGPLLAMVGETGEHRVVLTAKDPGWYRLRLGTTRQPSESERTRAAAVAHLSRGIRFSRRADNATRQKAVQEDEAALGLWSSGVDRALTLDRLGRAQESLRDYNASLKSYQRALEELGAGREERARAVLLQGIVRNYCQLHDYRRSLEPSVQSLSLFQRVGDRRGEAEALGNLALASKRLGDTRAALDLNDRALRLMEELRDTGQQATILYNIGRLYADMGRSQFALARFTKSLALSSELTEDTPTRSLTLSAAGMVHFERKEISQALRDLREAVDLTRRSGSSSELLSILKQLVGVELATGKIKRAHADLAEAERLDNSSICNQFMFLRGWAQELDGRMREARSLYQQAYPCSISNGDQISAVGVLYRLAQLEKSTNHLLEARKAIERALAMVEEMLSGTASLELRSSFLTSVQDRYEFYVELLMDLHHRDPRAGYDILAFEANEKARARAILDEITATGVEVRAQADPRLVEQERMLRRKIKALNEEERAVGVSADLESRIADLKADHERVEADIRASNPRIARLQPRPRTLEEIRRDVLDDDTVLLSYALGSARSFVWRIDRRSITSYELPPRKEITRKIRNLLDHMGSREEWQGEALRDAKGLSKVLLGKVGKLGSHRLLFAGDGPLQYVPFSALPDPASLQGGGLAKGQAWFAHPLAVDHEIVSLPSASTVAVLRQERAARPMALHALAVLADPIVEDDDRLKDLGLPRASPAGTMPTEPGGETERLPRLKASGEEAKEILRLVPISERYEAIGFKADLEAATDPILGRYRILHFATHARLRELPEQSGLIFSLYDKTGKKQENFLSALDIYSLDLPVETVVLSACQTAHGDGETGEGMGFLARGFLHAGAKRVVVSLWSVSDKATSELMKRFYEGLLQRPALSPAAALRQAQLSVAKKKGYEAPYYWAGFVLQGDWK
jgi:CHAT domain-containing protein/tetratricopeptide (TPR) repeat protein